MAKAWKKGWDPNDPLLYCQNMKLRLRQHQQICMGLSDVAGWGAFVNQKVKKDEFLGEVLPLRPPICIARLVG